MLRLDFKRFSFNHIILMVSRYWWIENQSGFTNESRNAMVLKYDLLIYSEVIRGIMHLVLCTSYNEKKVQLLCSSQFLK